MKAVCENTITAVYFVVNNYAFIEVERVSR